MTMLAYRPDWTLALENDSLSSSLSQDELDELRHIHEQAIALIAPLAQVQSLAEADRLAYLATSAYITLVTRRVELPSDVDALRKGAKVVGPLASSVRESTLMSDGVKEQWYGALESFAAYVDWFWASNADAADEDRQHTAAAIVQQTQSHAARAAMAFDALVLILNRNPGSTPDALPILAELADHCWTEIEDVFLGLAEYDDDGSTVPLSEVKSQLGL